MVEERSAPPPEIPTYHVIVIAHPDDESMFFVPTIRSLVKFPTYNIVWLVCLTTGNYDGLGTIRVAELKQASALLGISKVIVIDGEDETMIADHPTKRWNKDHVSSLLQSTLQEHIARAEQEKENVVQGATLPQNQIRQCRIVLITFDEFGVSGHVNHKDTYIAVLDYETAVTWIVGGGR
jgi:N-acetylglucosaminylphosphatidylinositol deacetylase